MTTAGQRLTAELRRYFRIGPRSRRYRTVQRWGRQDLHREITEAIEMACTQPLGFYTQHATDALMPGWPALLSHQKHYDGYRMSPTLRRHIELMSPWQFSALLGRMVDAGVTNVGEGERFYSAMAAELHAATS